jgi:hypothetical protein
MPPRAITVPFVTQKSLCYATMFDSRDCSPKGLDEFDAMAERTGMRSLFNRCHLDEVRENLRLQQQDYTMEQLATLSTFTGGTMHSLICPPTAPNHALQRTRRSHHSLS